jgi:hypothetical protein
MTEEDMTSNKEQLTLRRVASAWLVVVMVGLTIGAGAVVGAPASASAATDGASAGSVVGPVAQQNNSTNMSNGSSMGMGNGGDMANGSGMANASQMGNGSGMAQGQMAYVRIGHFSADAPAVDVFVDGEAAFTGVEYGDVSDYEALPAGEHRVRISAADDEDTVVFNDTVTVNANQAYTIDATGLLETGNEEYDFVASGGSADGPYLADGGPLVEQATVTVGDVNETTAVEFNNRSTDGTTVTVDSVTVPEGGFVAIHNLSLQDGNTLGSVIGVSEYLEPGTTEDVEITLFEDVEGTEFSQSELKNNANIPLIAMPHLDTDDNEEYDFVSSNGSADAPYTAGGGALVDQATVAVGEDTDETAAVDFDNQSFDGESVTVDSVTVPEGGFVAIHNESGAVIGVSESLEAGTTENVEVPLFEGVEGTEFNQSELENNSTLVAMPHYDRNESIAFAPLILQDRTQPPANAAAVRLVHAVPGVGPVDVTVGEGNNTTVLFDNATFRNGTDYVQVPGGEYTLDVRAATAANNGTIVQSVDVEVENGSSYTATAYGDTDIDGINLDTQVDGQIASVRVAHLSPDAPAVDVYVGNETFLTDVSQGTITDYESTTPTEQQVTITVADNRSAVLFDQTVPIAASDYTIVATGQVSPGATTDFTPLVIQDNGTAPDENTSAVQLVHAAPGVSTVDVTVEQNNSTTVLYDNVSFTDVSQYVQVPAGEYDLQIRAASSGNDGEIIETVGVDVEGGETYTAFATGETVDEFELLIEEDD